MKLLARSSWPWWVLLAGLALLLFGAAGLDRSAWPSLVGDEATYLMQAESLANDYDLLYERGDYDRFVRHHGVKPEGLILQSGDAGAHITFGKPFFYALYIAPFVRVAPRAGPFVANALLLAVAALFAAWVLGRWVGAAAPLWIAALVFASPTFAYTFWVHADLFLMCLCALGLGLVFAAGEQKGDSGRREIAAWVAAGLLLAVVAFSRPMYATIFLPALVVAYQRGRRRALPALLAGGLALLGLAAVEHLSLTHSLTSYGASRRGFYSYTGFPDVDFPAADWQQNLADWGNHAWLDVSTVSHQEVAPALLAWDTLYFLVGRHVGLLPYFLPLLLLFVGRPRGVASWSLLAAVALAAAAFFYVRPFNFWGGGGAIGNRYILPLVPAFWYLPRRPIRWPWIAAATLLAGLFMAPLWRHPRTFPLVVDGAYRYVSPVARRLLPYETTQSHLKPAGQEDVLHQGLWIKFLGPGVGALRSGELLRLRNGGGEILVGNATPLTALDLELRAPPSVGLAVTGGRLEDLGQSGAWHRFRLVPAGPRARHPMWWTWDTFYLYQLKLEVTGVGDGAVAFKVRAAG